MKHSSPQIGREEVRPQARTKDIVIQELPDEELVYDLKTHQAYCLNKTAAAIWKQCDGRQTIEEIALRLHPETDAVVSRAMVNVALHHLSKNNLLEQPADFSVEKPNQVRREVLRRIGLGAVAALPLVTSIIAPLSAQAMSCGSASNTTKQNAVGCACQTNSACNNSCCGFGSICANLGSVASGNNCRVNCECASGVCLAIPSAPDVCA